MKTETKNLLQILEEALDALWAEEGNGYGGPRERLIAELQLEIDRIVTEIVQQAIDKSK